MLLVVPGVLRIPMPPQFKFTLSSPSTLPQVLAVLLKGPLEDAAAAAEFKTKAAAAFPHRSVRGGGAEWEGSICPARNGGLFPRMRSQSRFVPPPPPPVLRTCSSTFGEGAKVQFERYTFDDMFEAFGRLSF